MDTDDNDEFFFTRKIYWNSRNTKDFKKYINY